MNENFPKPTSQEGDKRSSYIEMTVRGYNALINTQEKRFVLTNASGKGHEIKVGDGVKIHVENPQSSQTTPSGKVIFGKTGVNGILQGIGAKFAVVKYGEKNITIPIKEFLEDQTFSIEEQERKVEKNRQRVQSQPQFKPEYHAREKQAKNLLTDDNREAARRMGIDTSQPNWEKDYQQKLRKISGA